MNLNIYKYLYEPIDNYISIERSMILSAIYVSN